MIKNVMRLNAEVALIAQSPMVSGPDSPARSPGVSYSMPCSVTPGHCRAPLAYINLFGRIAMPTTSEHESYGPPNFQAAVPHPSSRQARTAQPILFWEGHPLIWLLISELMYLLKVIETPPSHREAFSTHSSIIFS